MACNDSQRPDEHDESSLVARAKEGDVDAFGELVNRYKRRIYQTAYQMTGSAVDADDLSQEAFVRAYQSIRGFDGRALFHTWLYRIVMNLSINHLKKQGRHRHVSLDAGPVMNENAQGSPLTANDCPREALQAKELRADIDRAIESLSLNERKVVVLTLLQGLSHRQAAGIECCSENTISWRLFRARAKLKKKLAAYLEEAGR